MADRGSVIVKIGADPSGPQKAFARGLRPDPVTPPRRDA
jgi:hypothetical protein